MNNHRYKYPRTSHLPWSPGYTYDDVRKSSTDPFLGKEIVVTEKMDGENTTMYAEHIHARSLDSRHHPSRDWVKGLHAKVANQIPENWRLCGENVYAKHAIFYDNLPSYFLLFSIWNDRNRCLSWDETVEWASLFDLVIPSVLYRGIWDQERLQELSIDTANCEGYVVRLADEFHYDDFSVSVAKWVRPQHVQTDQHWMHSNIEPNQLSTGAKNREGGHNE